MHKKTIVFTLLASTLFMISSCNSNIDDESLTPDIALYRDLPINFTYKDRDYWNIQGVGIKDYVNQEDIGELLGYFIREDDVDAFKEEYPNVDFIIDNNIYDQHYLYRIPFFMVIGYDDLSFICVIQELYVDITNFPQ